MSQSAAALKRTEGHSERGERRPVTLRAFGAREDGSTFELSLLDLSYEGCGIETAVKLAVGEALKLSVVGLGAIAARVRWFKDGKAGLIFDAVPAKPKQQWPRRHQRIELTAEVSMRRLGKINYRVRVYDISLEGCRVELIDRPRIDEIVMIKLDGLEALEAETCWVEGVTAGLKFARAIHPAVFDLLIARLQGCAAGSAA